MPYHRCVPPGRVEVDSYINRDHEQHQQRPQAVVRPASVEVWPLKAADAVRPPCNTFTPDMALQCSMRHPVTHIST